MTVNQFWVLGYWRSEHSMSVAPGEDPRRTARAGTCAGQVGIIVLLYLVAPCLGCYDERAAVCLAPVVHHLVVAPSVAQPVEFLL